MNILQRLLFNSFVQRVLNLIPLNGYKTALGVLLLILSGVMALAPVQYQILLQVLVETLQSLGAQPPVQGTLEAGLAAVVIGAIHKYIKAKSK